MRNQSPILSSYLESHIDTTSTWHDPLTWTLYDDALGLGSTTSGFKEALLI